MNFLRVFFMVTDPLIVGFIVSVIIGMLFKKASGVLLAKYLCVIFSALGYMMLYVYADRIWNNELIRYIVMLAPIIIILLFISIAVIVAPKEKTESSEMEKEHETAKFFTGWDSMFPDDLDEYGKHPKS